MKISDEMIRKIKAWEGCRLKAYRCPAGVWTIGYGQTGETVFGLVKRGMAITQEQADQLLMNDLAYRMNAVANMLSHDANQYQLDALVSLAYNIGIKALKRSSVMRWHNEWDYVRAANAFLLRNKARDPKTGKLRVLAGLTKRREVESDWYLGVETP